jgi:hypothetical protein
MAISPFTSVERRSAALVLALLLFNVTCARAGSIVTLTNGSESIGKLSIAGGAIHAEGPSAGPDTSLTDILQATFGDTPFTLGVFRADKLNQLPPNWSAQNIGDVISTGTVTVQDGAFTVTGSGADKHKDRELDHFFFVATPWPDDGQFTAHVASLDALGDTSMAGLMFRDSLDPKAVSCAALLSGAGQIRLPGRREAKRDDWGNATNGQAPLWLRFTRQGNNVFTSMSSDGNDWDIISGSPFKELTSPLVGFAGRGLGDKGIPKAVFDHVSLTPLPSSAQVLPAGVLLQGGSLLVGRLSHLSLDPAAGNNNGELLRGDEKVPIDRSAIAAVVFLPVTRAIVAENSTKAGLVMRNGDTMDGDVSDISSEQISVSSVLLGLSTYRASEVRACFLAPLQNKVAPYEVRLRDGSILYATAITGDASGVGITDVSGLDLRVGQDEIAQIRAGTAATQDLAQLDWKATGTKDAPTPQVDSWLGKDQQQILATDAGTAIEFPLPGKFRAFGVQVVVGADSPANATAVIHFLTDGHELAKSPALRVGDAPRFMELTLPTASHITVQSESTFPGTKVLYLDPVGIR